MNKTVTIDNFADAVQELLTEYGDEANVVVEKTITESAKKVQKEMRSESTGAFKNRSGGYRRSWSVTVQKQNLNIKAIVYARAPHYRLTHLLEYGHALVKGGRTIGHVKAFPHIEEANDRVQEEVLLKLKENMGR